MKPCEAKLELRRRVALDLLARSNDVCCFATWQYHETYCARHCQPDEPEGCEAARCERTRWAEEHLRSIPETVREVREGVWVAAGEG